MFHLLYNIYKCRWAEGQKQLKMIEQVTNYYTLLFVIDGLSTGNVYVYKANPLNDISYTVNLSSLVRLVS